MKAYFLQLILPILAMQMWQALALYKPGNNCSAVAASAGIAATFCKQFEYDVYSIHQHPHSLDSYINCTQGCPTLHNCEPNKFYNPQLQQCEALGNSDTACKPVPPDVNADYCQLLPPNFYDYPYDCSAYISCMTICPALEYCPDDKLYNPLLHICDTPNAVDCQPLPYPSTTTTTTTTSRPSTAQTAAPGVCIDLPDATLLPFADDCAKFVVCHNNEAIVQKCSSQLLFNPILLICDDPENVNCGGSTTTTMPATPTTAANPCADEQLGTTFPLESNCQQYILCMGNGQSVIAKCTSNAWYDPTTGDCGPNVSPEACRQELTTTAISTTTTTTTTQSPKELCIGQQQGTSFPLESNCQQYILCMGNDEYTIPNCIYNAWYDPQTGICGPNVSPDACRGVLTTTALPTTTLSPQELCTGQELGTSFPLESNCQKYILCMGNDEYSIPDCIYNAWYDPQTGICGPNVSPTACQDHEESTTAMTPTSQPAYDVCRHKNNGEIVAYPDNCRKYIVCVDPVPIGFNCLAGYYYSSKLQQCVEWQDSDCAHDGSSTLAPPATPNMCHNSARETYPFPDNCQWFIRCINDNVYMIEVCNMDEFYDPWLGKCGLDVSPVACQEYSTPTTSASTLSPGTPASTTYPISTAPCYNVMENKLVPYPNDCAKFIKCEQPIPVAYDCVEGQEFSAPLQRCMAPWVANCTVNSFQKRTSTAITLSTLSTPAEICRDKAEGTLVAQPGNCRKYIVCQAHTAIAHDCPSHSKFSLSKLKCVDAALADCSIEQSVAMLS